MLHAPRQHQEVKEGLGKDKMKQVIWQAYPVGSPLYFCDILCLKD